MVPEILDKHRKTFNAMASGWMEAGATCVQLAQGDTVLLGCPVLETAAAPALTATSQDQALTLRVYGDTDVRWTPAAESMVDMFAHMLIADADLDSLTAALVETQDRLVSLYELTQATRRTLDVPALLDLLLQQSRHLLDVDGGFVILQEKDQKPLIRQLSDAPLDSAHIEAAATLYFRDPHRHFFKESETLPAGLRNVMMVALPVRKDVSAAVGLFKKSGKFAMPDIKLANAIAGHIGAQLENAILHRESVERTRLETEMDIARQVQTAILPQSLPKVEGLDIFARSDPAFEVGGDFFDVIARADGSLVFALGDVTGKGMPAALLMSMTHTIIKSTSRNMPFTQPQQVLDRLNHDMAADFSNVGMFATVMLGLLDYANCELRFSNAGQSPIYYLPVGGEPKLLEAQDIPVGILDEVEYTTQTIQLSNGDVFVAASDGFPESHNAAEEMFGYDRMKNVLSAARNQSAKQIAATLMAEVDAFCGDHLQDDDRTLIIIKFGKLDEWNTMSNESLVILANYEALRAPCYRLRMLLNTAGIPEETINLCELALQELLTNLVDHAYAENPEGLITVKLSCTAETISMETQDTGISAKVDLAEVAMPDPSEFAEGGYGMAIIQSLMDEVVYTSEQGTNTWKLIKHLK